MASHAKSAALTPEWLAAPFASDVAAVPTPEVRIDRIPSGDALASKVKIAQAYGKELDRHGVARQNDALYLTAAKDFAAGDLVLAELAVAFVPVDAVRSGALDARGDSDSADKASAGGNDSTGYLTALRFAGPFDVRREAAVRVMAQLPTRVKSASRDNNEATPIAAEASQGRITDGISSRRELLHAAFSQRSILVSCGAGNPYLASREGGKASTDGRLHPSQTAHGSAATADDKGRVDNSAPEGSTGGAPFPSAASSKLPSSLPRFLALYPRSCLMRHSCAPNCGYRSVFEPYPMACPGIQVFASRPISKGEVLTIALCDPIAARPERRARLLQRYGFVCQCSRCGPLEPVEDDDAVAIKCGVCLSQSKAAAVGGSDVSSSTDVSRVGIVRPGRGCACSVCFSPPPSDLHLYTLRAEAIAAFHASMRDVASSVSESVGDLGGASPEQLLSPALQSSSPPSTSAFPPSSPPSLDVIKGALSALRSILHDTDAAVLTALHAALPLLAGAADPSGACSAAEAALALCAAGDTAAAWVPPHRRIDWQVEAGLLLGAAGQPEASGRAWKAAHDLAQPYLKSSAPQLLEAFSAFARKPPRNRAEAGFADKLRLEVAAWNS